MLYLTLFAFIVVSLRNYLNYWGFYLFLFSLLSCKPEKSTPRFTLLSPGDTGIDFINELIENDTLNVNEFDYMYNGGGVSVGDFNNDGLVDIFFTGNKVSSRLYVNRGDLKFEDVTEKAGLVTNQWTEGVTLVDINNDGYLDIYVSTSSRKNERLNKNMLFINTGVDDNGVPRFVEKANEYGIDDTGYNTQAVFFDYDKDGFLDLYVLSNAIEEFNRNTPRKKETTGFGKSTDKLYRNNGDGTFTNVSKEAGILIEGYGLGVAIGDINKDGWPDIYVANDFITNDILYINNGDGTFTNRINEMIKHQSLYGMGVDVADFNNDGLMDVVVVDMMPDKNLRQKSMFGNINYDRYMLELKMGYEPQYIRNTLQLNNGNNTFSEIGQLSGIYKTDWSWAPLFADFDNDGFKDLFVSNGYGKDITDLDYIVYRASLNAFGTEEIKKKKLYEEFKKLEDVKIPNFMYRNNGDLTFSDKSEDWGFVQPSLSNGVAFADLDNDGDLDLIINNINDIAFVYENNTDKIAARESGPNNYLKISLEGNPSNSMGIGSTIRVSYAREGQREQQHYEHYLTRGYKSSIDPTIHFGLGGIKVIDSLEITWPDGKYELLKNINVNQHLVLNHKNSSIKKEGEKRPFQPLFVNVEQAANLNHKHEAQDFIDFNYQRLLPHKHSENGPGLAVGDVNGDGLDDFFIGGSAESPGKIFLQLPDGTFEGSELPGKTYGDMGALFFDADNDGDLDLYVVSGGSRYHERSEAYQDRLYINDGMGNFTYQPGALPEMVTSGSVVTAADFDQDGDLDLFIGGRVVPGKYPFPAKSYILRNDGAKFTDVTNELCPELDDIGMVTAALWSDYNQDGLVDLILVGEWMPVTFLESQKTGEGGYKFVNVTQKLGLSGTSGWWNSIVSGDFNNDGHMDYVAGNLGLNSRYQASESEPVTVFAKDFDRNGSIDPIMFYYILGENYPAHPRDNLIDQIAFMRGRFPKYSDYGKTTFDNFFREGELEGAYTLKSNEFRSSLIENTGKSSFVVKPLPNEAQFSPAYGLLARDYDGDGHLDLLVAGNSYATEVNTGRYDASIGNFLKGDGKGNFRPVDVAHSGFFVDGNAKAMAELLGNNGETLILVSRNVDSLKALKAVTENSLTLALQPMDQKAVITYKNGVAKIQEFYYGSSYLSQSSRKLIVDNKVASIEIYDYAGNSRIYEPTLSNFSLVKKN